MMYSNNDPEFVPLIGPVKGLRYICRDPLLYYSIFDCSTSGCSESMCAASVCGVKKVSLQIFALTR
jgi:hypothetical protein